ncbi:MAG: hypothetical protein KAQ75_06595, partial [Bacteroidales bacterium]|nr:hypothetical protein [Bacteroidales bacterium]
MFYKLAFRAKDKLKQLRFFLLLTAFLSILIPLSNYKIDFVLPNGNQILDASNIQAKEQIVAEYNNNQTLVDASAKIRRLPSISFGVFVKYAYFLISLILVTRLLIQLILLGYQSIISEKFYQGKYVYVYNKRFENIFSFFNWIFVHKDLKGNKEIDGILMHEKIHASQYHSVDIIAIELLAAVMWFNPIVWMMRKEIQLVHEYLADEG